MYTPGGHRTSLLSGRVTELLESLKAEFETIAHDANLFKMQRDDYERKCTLIHRFRPPPTNWHTVTVSSYIL
jgi:hypothetical protein